MLTPFSYHFMSNNPSSEILAKTSGESSENPVSEAKSVSKLSAVEVLSLDEKEQHEITQKQPNNKNSWLPWKRPNRRDQQLSHLREGYIELLGLVRSISGHLDRQKDENSQVTTLVESLPPALNSFEKLADSQTEVTAILGNLNSHMETTRAKDDELLENMQGFNAVLKDVSTSNQKSLGTLHQVSERIEHSDEQMKVLFQQATQSNQAASSLMVRLEKRVFLSNLALIVLLSLLLLVGVVWLSKQRETVLPPPVIDPAPQAAAAPSAVTPPAQSVVPPIAPEMAPPVEAAEPVPFPTSSEENAQLEEEISLVEEDPALFRGTLLAPINGQEPGLLEESDALSQDVGEALDSGATTEEDEIETLELFEF